jgi:hypothetical protein
MKYLSKGYNSEFPKALIEKFIGDGRDLVDGTPTGRIFPLNTPILKFIKFLKIA